MKFWRFIISPPSWCYTIMYNAHGFVAVIQITLISWVLCVRPLYGPLWLKGLCHEMNNVFEGLYKQICAYSLKKFCCLLWRKWKIKLWLASKKTLTNFEYLSRNPLQIACCGIQEATYDFVNCSVSRRWFLSVLRTVFLFKINMWMIDYRLFQRLNGALRPSTKLFISWHCPFKPLINFLPCWPSFMTGSLPISVNIDSALYTIQGVTEYIFCVWEFVYPRLCCEGRTDPPGGVGDGGSIFWKTREIGLPSYNDLSTQGIVKQLLHQ